MAVGEQLTYNSERELFGGAVERHCQKVTVDYTIATLAFPLLKLGSPPGNITFAIRRVNGDGLIASKVWGAADDLTTSYIWKEVTLDSPVVIAEEVRIYVEYASGDTSNSVGAGFQNSDVAANENMGYYFEDAWGENAGFDAAYSYIGVATIEPTVTTQAMTAITGTTATGNGNITDLGSASVTQHGHCWNTTGTPTTADSKTTNGTAAATGAFTSSLTSLTSATKYYVKAYATNSYGTGYGEQVIFIAGALKGDEKSGVYAVVEERFHYVDAYGVERFIQGTAV